MFSRRSHARWAGPLTVALMAAGLGALGAPTASATKDATSVQDDFNGDGYADLAVGANHATVGGKSKAGYVAVTYGGPHGLSASNRSIISRATAGVPGSPTANQAFGTQLSRGDLDGDGYGDLVIASGTAGDLVIVWGGPRGLTGSTSVPDHWSTQTGDFDGDGHTDLALFEFGGGGGDEPGHTDVTVWKGPVSRAGLPAAVTRLDAGQLCCIEVSEKATGDVNGDGYDELLVSGYVGEGSYGTQLYVGSPNGLVYDDRVRAPGWGLAIAMGDVNGDGYDDIVVGVSDDSRIDIAYGAASGIVPREQWTSITQNTAGVPGTLEYEDAFGASLAVGDINGDGIDDIAVGAPGEALGTTHDAGVVDILRGSRSGVTGAGAQAITQNTAGVPGTAELGDGFGTTVRLLDINRNGYADLAAAATGEDGGNGAVWALRGRPTGIVPDAAFVFEGRTLGAPYAKAQFGYEIK
jgi:FG-GAP repeat protein/VCBS repeat protein